MAKVVLQLHDDGFMSLHVRTLAHRAESRCGVSVESVRDAFQLRPGLDSIIERAAPTFDPLGWDTWQNDRASDTPKRVARGRPQAS